VPYLVPIVERLLKLLNPMGVYEAAKMIRPRPGEYDTRYDSEAVFAKARILFPFFLTDPCWIRHSHHHDSVSLMVFEKRRPCTF
jgi:hypothetical protein